MNVQANDFGDYHCEGTNRRGTHYTIVNVYGKCYILMPTMFMGYLALPLSILAVFYSQAESSDDKTNFVLPPPPPDI